MAICPYCAVFAYLEVSEVLIATRELNLDACCEWNLAGWIDSIQDSSRRERVQSMLDATGLVVHDIFTQDGDNGNESVVHRGFRSDRLWLC